MVDYISISEQIRESVTATYSFFIFVLGEDPGFFFRGGVPLRNGVTDCKYEKGSFILGEGVHSLHHPPRSTPVHTCYDFVPAICHCGVFYSMSLHALKLLYSKFKKKTWFKTSILLGKLVTLVWNGDRHSREQKWPVHQLKTQVVHWHHTTEGTCDLSLASLLQLQLWCMLPQ